MQIEILLCYLFLVAHCKSGNPNFTKNDPHDQNISKLLKNVVLDYNELDTPEYLERIAAETAYLQRMGRFAQALRLLNQDGDFDAKMKNSYSPKAYKYYSTLL